MAMKRCTNGHFFDSNKYQFCPYCGISNMDASKTVPLMDDAYAVEPNVTVGETVGMEELRAKSGDANKTVGIMHKSTGIDPVVGWVVCVEGPSKGCDYRIKSERNFIGRDSKMDIALTKDNSVSRQSHAIISYNPRNNTFRLAVGESHSLVFLNGEEVFTPTPLKAFDIIELGETKLVFVPFCGGDFSW